MCVVRMYTYTFVCIHIHLYICTCIYKSMAVNSSLEVNRIRHKVKDSQELKYFDKSDPQPAPDDESMGDMII